MAIGKMLTNRAKYGSRTCYRYSVLIYKIKYISDAEMPRNQKQTLVENLKNLPILSAVAQVGSAAGVNKSSNVAKLK